MNIDTRTTKAMAPRLTGLRILVVDDSQINRYVAEKGLSREGADIMVANDGREALDALRERPNYFHAVLMDVQMPVMDGLSATHAIRNELGLRELPVIAVTAGVLQEERQKALDAGVNDILDKPLDMEKLVQLLHLLTRSGPGKRSSPTSGAEVTPPSRNRDPDFPVISGIDSYKAAQALAHDRELFFDLLRQFVTESGDTAQRIRIELAQGSREAATVRLHSFRGALGLVGAEELTRSALGLEESIRNNLPDSTSRLDAFDLEFASLIQAILPWLE